MTVMIVHIFYLLTARSLAKSAFRMNPLSNKRLLLGIIFTLGLHLLLVYVLAPLGINPFRVAPFPLEWWFVIILISLPGLFFIELEEKIAERLGKRQSLKNDR